MIIRLSQKLNDKLGIGSVTPIPVSHARAMCDSVDFVVALNTASSLRQQSSLVTPFDIANQVTTIMTADRMASQLQQADFVLRPAVAGR